LIFGCILSVWCRSEPIELGYSIVATIPIPREPDGDVGCVRGFFAKGGSLYLSYGGLSVSKFVKFTVDNNNTVVKRSQIELSKDFDARGATWCSADETMYQWSTGRQIARYTDVDGTLKQESELERESTDVANVTGVACKDDHFVASNGTNALLFLDSDLAAEREVDVNDTTKRRDQLSELEWIYGNVWANVEKDNVLRAYDAETGFIVFSLSVDALSEVAKTTCPGECVTKARANGIAFDTVTKKFYVTGMCWGNIYELRVHDPHHEQREIFAAPLVVHFWTKEISDDTVLGFAVGVGVCFCVSIVIYGVYACFGKKKPISWDKLEEDLARMGN